MTPYLFVAITVSLTVVSQVLQKQVAMAVGTSPENVIVAYAKQLRLWVALALLGLAMIAWLAVLAKLQVSKAYTLLSINYALMVPVSKLVFAEDIPWTRWLGAFVITAGVVCISWS
ncbi:MAG TPA: 4-amino-4-deoxy-L-arabinose-phospho-UDP flippase [Pseudomonadales bacterium]|nr:4-amino-4-deoxy-L-arabinose-phospho-UDP flippase [Pseudomonadales bacterium]